MGVTDYLNCYFEQTEEYVCYRKYPQKDKITILQHSIGKGIRVRLKIDQQILIKKLIFLLHTIVFEFSLVQFF